MPVRKRRFEVASYRYPKDQQGGELRVVPPRQSG